MKKVLFASTALAGLAIGGAASAEIALFGDARLGIGYNILNDGVVNLSEEITNDDGVVIRREADDDLRAVSRVRFGVTMTGESDAGITFGATIRADNAGNGQGGEDGQRAGDVFVSGAWGTLTYGDTNGADEQHVGDAGGNYSLTGLGDFNETPFVSNGGGFGDDSIQFANNPDARPTVRYDYNFAGFGVSASTNRDLNDIGVGASYTFDFAGGSVTGGAGYYDFQEFDISGGAGLPGGTTVRGGEQYSVGLTGNFGGFSAGVVYTAASADYNTGDDRVGGDLDILNASLGYELDRWAFNVFYAGVMTANGPLGVFDDKEAYGLTGQFDLGGGASVNAGVMRTYGRDSFGDPGDDDFIPEVDRTYVADFGIKMAF